VFRSEGGTVLRRGAQPESAGGLRRTPYRSLPFDDACARVYGHIRARLMQAGLPIGPNDLLIAAAAIAFDTVLVTHNNREFARVDGLVCEDRQT
jgi:tRNA(fMet)-specific endonuclease VapC